MASTGMDASTHDLKTLLQLHLSTDISAADHLPIVLATLDEECFLPSPQLSKWTARINSLLHSKEPCGRWAGLCLAHRTSEFSKEIMIEYAQGWLSAALPLLSKNEPVPVLKAAIRLAYKIFNGAMDTPEYQRQVSIPNVPKMTTAMIALVEKLADVDFKIFIFGVLSRVVSLYPNLHRAPHPVLSSLALSYLDGSASTPSNANLLDAASQLYVALHLTGGKVGAAACWRKSIEDTINFGWNAFFALRTTFPIEVQGVHVPPQARTDDPLIAVPLNLDRLRCCVSVFRELLRTPTPRPVELPLGSLVKFCLALLTCSRDSQIDGHIDANTRAMELMIVPEIWKSGSQILRYISASSRHYLTSHVTRLIACLTIHLERKPKASLRLQYLESLEALMKHCHPIDSDLIPNRLTKAILPSLTVILAETGNASGGSNQPPTKRKGKKRNRAFEGDEILKGTREVICRTPEDQKSLILALEVVRHLLHNPNLTSQMQSISSRVLIALHLSLPRLPSALLAADPTFQTHLSKKIQEVITDVATGTTNVSSRALGLIAAFSENNNVLQGHLDLLLHPRVPPLIRREPYVESLALLSSEESQEEASIRADLGLGIPRTTSRPPTDSPDKHVHHLPLQNHAVGTQEPAVVDHMPKDTPQTVAHTSPNSGTATQIIAETQTDLVSEINQSKDNFQLDRTVNMALSTMSQPQIQLPQVRLQPIVTPRSESMDDDEEMPTIDMASDTDGSDS